MKNPKLMTTIEMLDAIKSLKNIESDYAAAKILNVKPQTVSSWRLRGSIFDDETAFKVADLLGVQPEYVIACAHAERSKTDQAKQSWSRMAAAFGAAACAVLVVGILAPLPFF